jgi:transglutaminase-like putative cysteine protease
MAQPTEGAGVAAEIRGADRAAGYWLLAAAIVVLLPLVPRFSWWLTLVLATLFGWRFLMLRRAWPSPGRALRLLLTVGLVIALWRHHGMLFGRDAGTSLLAAMLALKFLELQRLRDYVLCALLMYFLILLGFLYSQAIWLVVYLLLVFVLTTAMLVRLAVPSATAKYALRLASVLLLQALPLMLLMHLLFPRLQGSMWGLPQDAYAGMTGLNDTMEPGSINELSLSEEIAFRAEFHGAAPPPHQRYWRALVLWSTNGRTWRRGNVQPASDHASDRRGGSFAYSLVLEPSNRPWIPALDFPVVTPSGTRLRAGLVLEHARPIRERQLLEMEADPQLRVMGLDEAERKAALQLPARQSARVVALVSELRAQGRPDEDVVNALLRYFHDKEFHYTLEPPLLGDDPVDEFLFETRRGFCEHYASAFVTLMRVAGVPARVVTGYQGGEYNPTGRYFVVRQSDAHAWAEVWLRGKGWMRVDPTAAIAPERIDFGASALRQLVAQGAPLGGLAPAAVRNLLAPSDFERLRRGLVFAWDAVNTGWQRWVLDYDFERQRALLAAIGLARFEPVRLVGLLALAIAVLLGGYALSSRQRSPLDPVQRLYEKYCRRLANCGLERANHEGPVDFAERCARQRPDLARATGTITDLYVQLRYAGIADDELRKRLAQAVASFRPRGRPAPSRP